MIKLGGLVTLKPITEVKMYLLLQVKKLVQLLYSNLKMQEMVKSNGTHEKRKDDKDGGVKDPTDKPKVNIFKKDKEEPKKDEPKDDGRPKDSTGGRGNPEVNKAVRKKAQSLGITPQKLGKEEYESRMKKAN